MLTTKRESCITIPLRDKDIEDAAERNGSFEKQTKKKHKKLKLYKL